MQWAQNALRGNGHTRTEEAKAAKLERLIGHFSEPAYDLIRLNSKLGSLPFVEHENTFHKNRDKKQTITPQLNASSIGFSPAAIKQYPADVLAITHTLRNIVKIGLRSPGSVEAQNRDVIELQLHK